MKGFFGVLFVLVGVFFFPLYLHQAIQAATSYLRLQISKDRSNVVETQCMLQEFPTGNRRL